MKVTVTVKEKEKNEIPFDEIPVGIVYVVSGHSGPIALKLNNNEAVLLCHNDKSNWFQLVGGLTSAPAYKVLGKLAEIIVEE